MLAYLLACFFVCLFHCLSILSPLLLVGLFLFLLSVYPHYFRIHLGVHTIGQVCIGTLFGITFGYLYHLLCRHYIWHLYSAIEQTEIAQYFLLKDSSNIATNCLAFERENAIRAKQEKKQKIQTKSK